MIRQLIILLFLLMFFSLPALAGVDTATVMKRAEAGDVQAQTLLGQMYEWGIDGVKQDHAESMKWFRKAAEQGNARAQGHLGFVYMVGEEVKRDEVEAFKWYRKAAEQGDAGDQRQIGNMYFEGWGVKKDDAEGVKWLRKAADQGHWLAQQEFGELYAKGEKVKQDYAEAYYWYSLCQFNTTSLVKHLTQEQKAVADKRVAEWEKMHPPPAATPPVYGPPAPVTEREIIEARLAHTGMDYRTAAKLFRSLAERGNGEAQQQLGELYRYGQGVKKDDVEAVKWFLKAFQTLHPLAEQGDMWAQGRIGNMYEDGEGLKKDYAEALFWYEVSNCKCDVPEGALTPEQMAAVKKRVDDWDRQAADQGDARAQYNIGFIYERGQGVTKDPKEAYMWYSLAAAAGNKWVAADFIHLAAGMTPEDIDEGKRRAAVWLKAHPAPASAAPPAGK